MHFLKLWIRHVGNGVPPGYRTCVTPRRLFLPQEPYFTQWEPKMAETSLPLGGVSSSRKQKFGQPVVGIRLEFWGVRACHGFGFSLLEKHAAPL